MVGLASTRRRVLPVVARAAVATALLLAARAAGAEPVIRVGAADGIGADLLADALRLRLDVPVRIAAGDESGDGDAWRLDVVESVDGRSVRLRSPEGDRWDRPLASSGPSSPRDRAREAALAAASLWAEASNAGPRPPLVPSAADAAGGAGDDAAMPRFGLEWGMGAEGDLWGEASGRTIGAFTVLRPSLVWPWGLWVHLEAGFGASWADAGEALGLATTPVRIGGGWEFPFETGSFRLALQGSVQPWLSLGGVEHRGWRAGAGLLACASWHPVPGVAMGADLGVEFLPRAVELRYRDEAVLGLGQLRWRAGAWIGFEFGEM
jgi:hypothetical protein